MNYGAAVCKYCRKHFLKRIETQFTCGDFTCKQRRRAENQRIWEEKQREKKKKS